VGGIPLCTAVCILVGHASVALKQVHDALRVAIVLRGGLAFLERPGYRVRVYVTRRIDVHLLRSISLGVSSRDVLMECTHSAMRDSGVYLVLVHNCLERRAAGCLTDQHSRDYLRNSHTGILK